jgi:choline transport protein
MSLPTKEQSSLPSSDSEKGTMADDNEPRLMEVNETGHIQELERNFSLFSICSVGIVTGNTWAALGGSIVVAIYNGGPPGVLYEFIAVSIFYWLVAASIAVRYILQSLRTRSLQSLRS